MTKVDFLTPLHKIPGFSGNRGEVLRKRGISTAGALLSLFPLSHFFAEKRTLLAELFSAPVHSSASGKLVSAVFPPHTADTVITLEDSSGLHAFPVQIHRSQQKDLKIGAEFAVLKTEHTPYECIALKSEMFSTLRSIPRYPLTSDLYEAGITQQFLTETLYKIIFSGGSFPERLPRAVEDRHRFPPLREAFAEMHFPSSGSSDHRFVKRIVYEKLYQKALTLRWNRKRASLPGIQSKGELLQKQFIESIPCTLSESQQSAVDFLGAVSRSEQRMHHLLFGRTGTGRTLTALTASVHALADSGQVIWVCQNDICAEQQFPVLSEHLALIGITAVLISRKCSDAEKRSHLRGLKTGEIQFAAVSAELFGELNGLPRLTMITADRPLVCSAELRAQYLRKSASADILIIPLDEKSVEHEPTLPDFHHCRMKNPDNLFPAVKVRTVEPERLCDLAEYLKMQKRPILWIIPSGSADASQQEEELAKAASLMGDKNIIRLQKQSDDEYETEIFDSAALLLAASADLPNLSVQFPLTVIDNSQRLSSEEIAQIRREHCRTEEDSWLFLVKTGEPDNRFTCQKSADLSFSEVLEDLESILIPE